MKIRLKCIVVRFLEKLAVLAISFSEAKSSVCDDLVDSDVVIIESSEEEISTLVPGQASATNRCGLLFTIRVNGGSLNVNDELFGWEIPDLDSMLSS